MVVCHGCRASLCSGCRVLVEDAHGAELPYCRDCRPTAWLRMPWAARRLLLVEDIKKLLAGSPHEVLVDGEYEVWRWEAGEFRLRIPPPVSAGFLQGEGAL